MTAVYTIAIERNQTYGHGDFGTDQMIIRMGSYGTGSFPPVFESRHEAEAWLKENGSKFHEKASVVQLDLCSPKQPKNKLFPIDPIV